MVEVISLVAGVLLIIWLGGLALAALDAPSWDKEILREPPRPIDLTGRRR